MLSNFKFWSLFQDPRGQDLAVTVKSMPGRQAAPLDYLAAAAARYEYQHYPKGNIKIPKDLSF